MSADPVRIRRATTAELSAADIAALRALLWAAFPPGDDEGFTEDDWGHAIGGVHFLLDVGDQLVAHASVVDRELHIGGHPLRTGYVEAVAVDPARQREGFGSRVMREVTSHIESGYELGALGTGSHGFYERLGWRRWRGTLSVRTDDGEVRTPKDEEYVMVLETPSSSPFDLDAPLSCEWRPGDVW